MNKALLFILSAIFCAALCSLCYYPRKDELDQGVFCHNLDFYTAKECCKACGNSIMVHKDIDGRCIYDPSLKNFEDDDVEVAELRAYRKLLLFLRT